MKNNDKALAIFMENISDISKQLAELQEHIDNCMNESPESINWSHVASAEKIASDISNIMAFLGLKQEAE